MNEGMNKTEREEFAKTEIETLYKYIDGFVYTLITEMNTLKEKEDALTDESVSSNFQRLLKETNSIHAILNNFIIIIADYLPSKHYGEKYIWEEVFDSMNDVIHFIVTETHNKHTDYIEQLLDLNKSTLSSTIHNNVLYSWNVKIQQIIRGLLSKLNNLRIKLSKNEMEVFELFIMNGMKKSKHEHSLYI